MDNIALPEAPKVTAAVPSEAPQLAREPNTAKASKFKFGFLPIVISVAALFVSALALGYNLGFIRPHEDHDVVARVLGVSAFTKGFSSIETNGELVVSTALINRGNQTEIIREVFLCYSDTKDFTARGKAYQRDDAQTSIQLTKGDKRVIRISTPFNNINTNKRMWVGVVVRAVAPNADDTEVTIPICEIELAADGQGAWASYNKDQTPLVQVVSNKRMPHQRIAPDGW